MGDECPAILLPVVPRGLAPIPRRIEQQAEEEEAAATAVASHLPPETAAQTDPINIKITFSLPSPPLLPLFLCPTFGDHIE